MTANILTTTQENNLLSKLHENEKALKKYKKLRAMYLLYKYIKELNNQQDHFNSTHDIEEILNSMKNHYEHKSLGSSLGLLKNDKDETELLESILSFDTNPDKEYDISFCEDEIRKIAENFKSSDGTDTDFLEKKLRKKLKEFESIGDIKVEVEKVKDKVRGLTKK